MRRFELGLLTTVICLSMLVTACGNGSRPFDRAAAVARIETRLAEDQAWKERYRPLAARKKQGEDVDAELRSLKAERPRLADLKDDALRIIDANPSDQAAFQAIGIVMKTNRIDDMKNWEGSENQALQERMLNVLLQHHSQRPELLDVIYTHFSNSEAAVAFWEKVFNASPVATVRASVAYKLTRDYSRWLDQIDLSPAKRQELRHQVQRYGGLLRSEYADASSLAEQADKFLAALNYAPGATLPSIAVTTVAGGSDTLTNYRGKVVLLDFWATWCGYCRRDHPKLVAIKQEMAGKPFEVISISADESPQMVTDYIAKEQQLPWPQWYVGPEGDLLKMWGVSGFPTYLLIDASGVVQARGVSPYLDAINDHARELVAQIESGQLESTSRKTLPAVAQNY